MTDTRSYEAAEYLDRLEPAPAGPTKVGGRMSNAERARPALEAIASVVDDRCGEWFVVARYGNEKSATSARAAIKKRIDSLGIKIPKHCWWEFGTTTTGEVLARLHTHPEDQ